MGAHASTRSPQLFPCRGEHFDRLTSLQVDDDTFRLGDRARSPSHRCRRPAVVVCACVQELFATPAVRCRHWCASPRRQQAGQLPHHRGRGLARATPELVIAFDVDADRPRRGCSRQNVRRGQPAFAHLKQRTSTARTPRFSSIGRSSSLRTQLPWSRLLQRRQAGQGAARTVLQASTVMVSPRPSLETTRLPTRARIRSIPPENLAHGNDQRGARSARNKALDAAVTQSAEAPSLLHFTLCEPQRHHGPASSV